MSRLLDRAITVALWVAVVLFGIVLAIVMHLAIEESYPDQQSGQAVIEPDPLHYCFEVERADGTLSLDCYLRADRPIYEDGFLVEPTVVVRESEMAGWSR